jgi:acyl-CoA synthetase (AMP-forming)/AMP-acid ligase II
MHQLIVSRVTAGHRRPAKAPLFRFVRSSSAPLPARLFNDIEGVFGCPAIEAYSMTEAAHQVTSNELPPGRRAAGSVGRPAGSEVSISCDGRPATVGEAGEILIRGATVMAGYEGSPDVNRDAFVHGWLRTGDQGVLDGDGRLRITGRLTEIINRGGEKIAPLEIDNVFLSHPAVRQAVAFAVPHETLGEDVAVAIVLQPGATTTSRDIRRFAARSLADFKVPRRVVFVKAVPAGPTGKPLRTRLTAALGLGSSRGRLVDKPA